MSEFDSKQLERGIEIEKEHEPTLDKLKKDVKEHGDITMSPRDVYKSISEDHLDEFKDYYTSLTEMENESEERSPKETQQRIDDGPEELEEAAYLQFSIREAQQVFHRRVLEYYETITPESAEKGDVSSRGTHNIANFQFDTEDAKEIVDTTVKYLQQHGATEPSSTEYNPRLWYKTVDPDTNYQSGEETYYSFILDGYTPYEEKAIFDRMIGRQVFSLANMNFSQRELTMKTAMSIDEASKQTDQQLKQGIFWWSGIQAPWAKESLKSAIDIVKRRSMKKDPRILEMEKAGWIKILPFAPQVKEIIDYIESLTGEKSRQLAAHIRR